MNRIAIWSAAGVLVLAGAASGQSAKVFRGEVSDSHQNQSDPCSED